MSRPGQTEEGASAFDDLGDNVEDVQSEENEVEETPPVDEAPAVRADGKPFTAADLRALKESLSKARKEARALKSGKSPEDKDEKPVADAVAEATRAAEARYKPIVVRQAARAALAEAGIRQPRDRSDSVMTRALKLIDISELDITEDGEIEGLEEQIEEIKADFPELFSQSRRPGRIDGAPRDGSGNAKTKTSSEKLAALFG